MSYQAYLFDFDYTLADSSRGIVMCFRNVLERHGYADVTDDAIRRTIGKTLEESFSILTGITDADRLADFKQQYRQEADIHMTRNTHLFPETLRVLRALKRRGARVGIISTKYRFRIHELLDQYLPADFLDIVVGGEDVSRAKPDPEGLLFAIGRLGIKKKHILYIGDSTVDAETAQAAGVDFAGVTHGVTTADELRRYPHRHIMTTLDELLAPPRISIGQIVLLSLLGMFICAESFPLDEDPTFIFLTLFLLYLWKVARCRRILPTAVRTWLNKQLHPLTVRYRACHIRQIRGKKPAPLSTQTCTCRNCGHTYTGNFCPRCGQTRGVYRFQLKHAAGNILRSLFRVDGKFGHTLIALLYRPGHLMRGFMQGRRAAYSMPLQTLFLLVAFYLLAMQLVILQPQDRSKEATPMPDSVKIERLQESIVELLEENAQDPDFISQSANNIAIANMQAQLDGLLPADSIAPSLTHKEADDNSISSLLNHSRLRQHLSSWLAQSPFLSHVWTLLERWGHGNRTLQIILILPFLAVGTYWAFQSRRRLRRHPTQVRFNLMEHFFIQAYIAAQAILLSILCLPVGLTDYADDLFALPWWFLFLLFWWDMRQLYLCSWWDSLKRSALVYVYGSLLFVAVCITLAGIIILGELCLRTL